MRIFTINQAEVSRGAELVDLSSTNGRDYIGITVGEKGRGRSLGVLSVRPNKQILTFAAKPLIYYGALGKTLQGNPNLWEVAEPTTTDEAVIVVRTMHGFRGGIGYSGDIDSDGNYKPFPFDILVEGRVAQGEIGEKGGGQQYIFVARKGEVFRIQRTGKTFGKPSEYFYVFDGDKVLCATAAERAATNCF